MNECPSFSSQQHISFFLISTTYFLVAVTVPKGTDKGLVRENGQRAKGTVKWFIDDLFVHQSGIRSGCSRSLSEGETVESGSAAVLSLLMLTGPDGATASGGSVATT
ncbi:hypothetical protein R3W88_013814 [Solanum pinnatisectum]|uniref:Uncharacterized protein n=1 Tax=Solanum pinnatisectum TaxID=50273 RepID=A0AAV9KQB1_9SOLN|nr:hypothetical protein R3W88_013814 [Solanum pinnatisectum]